MNIGCLPDDILVKVFSNLSLLDLVKNVRHTCVICGASSVVTFICGERCVLDRMSQAFDLSEMSSWEWPTSLKSLNVKIEKYLNI